MNPALALLPWGRIAMIAGVLAVLAWVGYQIRDGGKDAGLAEGEKARAALTEKLAHAQAQASTCSGTLERISTETERGLAEAAERAAAGERAANEAEQAAKAARQAKERAERSLAESKRVPACKVQLETVLCDSIPLL